MTDSVCKHGGMACVAVLAWLVGATFFGAGRVVAGDAVAGPAGAEPGDTGPEAPAGTQGASLEGFNLGRLAQLEQQGNGGQEEGAPVLAGWDKSEGFYIKDSEGLYKLVISGRVQIRYTYKGRDERGDTVDPDGDGDGIDVDEVGGEDDSFLELERARLKLKGHVLTPRLQYEFQIDGDTDDSGTVELLDYFVLYDAAMNEENTKSLLSIGAGQHKSYFLRQEQTSSSKMAFPDRSLANEFFNIDRNLGIWLEGDLGIFFYALEVANGFDSINRAPGTVDQVPAFIGKFDINILGNYGYEESGVKCKDEADFVIGASLASDQNNGSSGVDGQEYKVYQFGLDTGFRLGVFNAQAEYMGRWLDLDEDAEGTLYHHGFYAQSGIFLIPSVLELAGRVSVVYGDEGADFSGAGVEAGPGLNWFISKSHKVKLQTYVVYFDLPSELPPATEGLDGTDLPAAPGDPIPLSSFSSSSANLQAGEQGIMVQTQLQLEF